MRSPVAFMENRQTPPQQGSAGFLAPKYVAALLVFILSVTFCEFRSSTFIGDGLRHLPALRTITEGPTVVFKPDNSVRFIGLPILFIGRANSNSAPRHSFSV
jgi:hypothetical protein